MWVAFGKIGKIAIFAKYKSAIESMFAQIESFPSVEICLLSVDLEKNGHFVKNLGYLCNKDLGKNSADENLRYLCVL
jgi:hypothetical protein